jgi:endoglucanase
MTALSIASVLRKWRLLLPILLLPLPGVAAEDSGDDDHLGMTHGVTAVSKRVLLVQYINLVPQVPAKDFPWRSLRIFSPDDPAFADGRPAADGSLWVRPLRCSQKDPKSVKAMWLFLTLDRDLSPERTYEVRSPDVNLLPLDATHGRPMPGGAVAPPPVSFRWHGDRQRSPAIQANQIGYLPDGPKFAYLSQYAGYQFGQNRNVDLNFGGYSRFQVVEAETGKAVHQGRIEPAAANRDRHQHRTDEMSQSRVWEIDFSGFQEPGRYRVVIPGVGSSAPFVIAPDVYNLVFGVLCRGMLHQRCGVELAEPWTRHPHAACHLDDARIPLVAEYQRDDLRLFPQEAGQLACAGGHHAGSHYDKSVLQEALFAERLLLPFEAMPGQLDYLACPVPESGDDIPDLLQEVKRSLDWLTRMQDADGGFFTAVRPSPIPEFEEGLAGHPSAKFAKPRCVGWKDTPATAAAGAVLAHAARMPEFQRRWPDATRTYLEQAEKAWAFCQEQAGIDSRIRTVDVNADGQFLEALDELCWFAAELWLTTGRTECHQFFLRRHRPDDGWRWTWLPLAEASGAATRAYAFGQRDNADPAMRETCRAAILRAARETTAWQEKWAFRASFPNDLFQARRWAWYFLSEVASYDLLLATTLTDKADLAKQFRDAALRNADQELGNQPGGLTMITGLGNNRPTDHAHQLTRHSGIAEPIPGIPLGFHPSGFTPTPQMKISLEANLHGERPFAYRYVDGWNLEQEFSLPALAATVMTYAMLGDPARQQPGFPILNISANAQSERLTGTAPFTVSFRGAASGSNGKFIREWYWDLDNGDFRSAREFTHTFSTPGEFRVGCTVTDDDGWPAFRLLSIRVLPPVVDTASPAGP